MRKLSSLPTQLSSLLSACEHGRAIRLWGCGYHTTGSFPFLVVPGHRKKLGMCRREEKTDLQGAQGMPELQP